MKTIKTLTEVCGYVSMGVWKFVHTHSRTHKLTYGLLMLLSLFGLPLKASANAAQLTSTILDGGGRRVTSANYTIDGSLTGIAGISASPGEQHVAQHGYIGQLTEVIDLTLAGSPHEVAETNTTQLAALAVNDDDTVTVVPANEVRWDEADWPLAAIDANGLALADAVYEDTPAPFSGSWFGVAGTGAVQVINVDDDNFGMYANDGPPTRARPIRPGAGYTGSGCARPEDIRWLSFALPSTNEYRRGRMNDYHHAKEKEEETWPRR